MHERALGRILTCAYRLAAIRELAIRLLAYRPLVNLSVLLQQILASHYYTSLLQTLSRGVSQNGRDCSYARHSLGNVCVLFLVNSLGISVLNFGARPPSERRLFLLDTSRCLT